MTATRSRRLRRPSRPKSTVPKAEPSDIVGRRLSARWKSARTRGCYDPHTSAQNKTSRSWYLSFPLFSPQGLTPPAGEARTRRETRGTRVVMKLNTIGSAVFGDVAQLGEHLLCTQGVTGSSPVISTRTLSTE
jgi:hypothetical protein